jgi:NTP pyrophosphatase (non-canonical NTP hydrolase)
VTDPVTRPGHYAIGPRDGSYEWHIGTADRRECDQCGVTRPEDLAGLRATLDQHYPAVDFGYEQIACSCGATFPEDGQTDAYLDHLAAVLTGGRSPDPAKALTEFLDEHSPEVWSWTTEKIGRRFAQDAAHFWYGDHGMATGGNVPPPGRSPGAAPEPKASPSDAKVWGSTAPETGGLREALDAIEAEARPLYGKPGESHDWQDGVEWVLRRVRTALATPEPVPGAEGLRPVVVGFAHEMERKLRENDFKGGWEGEDIDWLLRRLDEEAVELALAVHSGKPAAEVRGEAADVANFALMVADNIGPGLALATPEPVPGADGLLDVDTMERAVRYAHLALSRSAAEPEWDPDDPAIVFVALVASPGAIARVLAAEYARLSGETPG